MLTWSYYQCLFLSF